MAFTNNLKNQVDMPVWEWIRFAPVVTAAGSGMTGIPVKGGRYLYYMALAALYRYDTFTDSWCQLASSPQTPVTLLSIKYAPQCGYYGRVIAAGSTSSKTQIAGLDNGSLEGYTIEIIEGKGTGQIRTIGLVEKPVIHEYGNATSGAVTSLTDTNAGILKRNWVTNQWRDYQLRIYMGTGTTQYRRILSNTATALTVADYNWSAIEAWFYAPFVTAPAAGSLYQIESSIINVTSPWSVQPDSTSRFVIKSGGIWALSSLAASPYYSWQYYDMAAGMWYTKSCALNLFGLAAAIPTDVAIEVIPDLDTPVVTGTLSGNGVNGTDAGYTMVDSSKSWTTGAYSNYVVNVKETATELVQKRNILMNDATRIWSVNKWKTVPQASTYTYTITPDTNKIYVVGGGMSSMYQYCFAEDIWLPSKIYDYGVARSFSAQLKNGSLAADSAIGLSAGTRTTTGILTAAVGGAGTNYRIDDVITVAGGGSGGLLRVTGINRATGAVTSVALEATGTGYTAGATVATTGGTGTSFTANITVGAVATVTPVIATINFKLGEVIDVAGDTSVGNYYNGSNLTIIGITATTISYACNASAAASAAFTAQATTILYDQSKSWTAGEHIGKYLLIYAVQSGGQGITSQCRKISANTATSITVTGAITEAVNGTSRYCIIDSRQFGTEATFRGDVLRGGLMSVCTGIDGGATAKTSLSDSTRAWVSNYWKDLASRKIRILCGPNFGTEIPITSNSSNTLYFAAQASEMTTDNVYCIMDNYGVASGTGSATTLVDTSQYWITGSQVGKKVKMLAVNTDAANHGTEFLLSASAANTLTTAATLTSTVAGTGYSILHLPPRGAAVGLMYVPNITTGDGSTPDSDAKGRYLISIRGGGFNEFARYDIAREIWNILTPSPQFQTFTTGAMYGYDGLDRIYISSEVSTALMTGRIFYYDIPKSKIENGGQVPYGFGAGVLGNRLSIIQTADGLKYIYLMRNTDSVFWRCLLFN